MDLAEYSMIAQIVLSVISFVGIVVSMWVSIRTLREVQTDRKVRQRPYLGFEIGGYIIPVEFQKAGKTIPGIDPGFVSKMFSNMPDDAKSVRIRDKKSKDGITEITSYGHLRNYGLGPALAVTVTWVPKEVWMGLEKTSRDLQKSLEPQYQEVLNCMPSTPSHILPGKDAKLTRLPTFIEKDYRRQITRVEGVLQIECNDVFEEMKIVMQEFHIFTYYEQDQPQILVSFGDFVG